MLENPFTDAPLRDALRAEAEKQRPLRVEQLYAVTEYIVPPMLVPREHADLALLASHLEQHYRVSLDTSVIANLPLERPMEAVEVMRLVMRNEGVLLFTNGMLVIENPERHTPILHMSVSTEGFSAAVVGSTIESSHLAEKVAEALWASAGAPRRWSELAPHIQKVAYTTTTRVHLGVNVEDWFRPSFYKFMQENVMSAGSFGAKMGRRSPSSSPDASDDVIIVCDIHDIKMRVSRFNCVTGRSEQCDVHFYVTARDEARHGIITITTELPSSEHTDFIAALRKALATPGS